LPVFKSCSRIRLCLFQHKIQRNPLANTCVHITACQIKSFRQACSTKKKVKLNVLCPFVIMLRTTEPTVTLYLCKSNQESFSFITFQGTKGDQRHMTEVPIIYQSKLELHVRFNYSIKKSPSVTNKERSPNNMYFTRPTILFPQDSQQLLTAGLSI
jgi:hypothetical protein